MVKCNIVRVCYTEGGGMGGGVCVCAKMGGGDR